MSKLRLFLVPSFSKHPLNFVFLFLIFVGSFSFASLALAFEDDGSWTTGKYYYIGNVWGAFGPTKSAACSSWASATGNSEAFESGGYCYHRPNSPYKETILQGTCEPGLPNSGCGEEPAPVNNCPEAGETKRIRTLINGTMENGQFVPRDTSKPQTTTLVIGGGATVDGCRYAKPTSPESPGYGEKVDVSCIANLSRQIMCYRWETMVSTGPAEDDKPQVTDELEEQAEIPEGEAEKKHLETTTDKVIGDVTVTDMAGTSSKTQTTVETLVKEKGAVVVDSKETSVLTMSDGIQRTLTTTVTELEFPDGTKRVITETNTAYTQTPKTVFNIDNSAGTTSITVVNGSSANYSETNTKGYDADGNLISDKTESSGSGDGEAQEEKEGEECKEDPEACEGGEFIKGEKGSFDDKIAKDALDAVLAEYDEKFGEVKEGLEDVFSFNLNRGGGSVKGSEISFRGYEINQSNNAVRWFDYINMGSIVMLIAALASAFILLRRNG